MGVSSSSTVDPEVIILGEVGVGKTSLMNFLLHGKQSTAAMGVEKVNSYNINIGKLFYMACIILLFYIS